MPLILFADDDNSIRSAVKLSLLGSDYIVREASNLYQIETEIAKYRFDLIILDIHFENLTSLGLMKKLQKSQSLPPTIVLSGAASAREAVEAIALGAFDFLEKPISSEKLKVAMTRCLEHYALKLQVTSFSKPQILNPQFIGDSSPMSRVRELIATYSDKDVKVLITGETGTGKEVVAQSIWQNSHLNNAPFICVNSSAIPDELIESELFGHKKGAFTGATSDYSGKIELASGGTLFLDEVGDLSAKAQTKLLRFLETNEIQPLGSNETKKVSVRLICATSRDVESEVEKGLFREDLYYRINVARIEIPPVRSRGDDVKTLFRFFMDKFSSKYGQLTCDIDDAAMNHVVKYDWPGNVRQIKNTCERLALVSKGSITEQDILSILTGLPSRKEQTYKPKLPETPKSRNYVSLKQFKMEAESQYIREVLQHCEGHVSDAAKILDLDRTYLHQKIKQLKIQK